MAVNQVVEYGHKLEERLKTEGNLLVQDVSAWLTAEEVPPEKLGLILAWGAKRGADRWHKDGDTLIPGPRPTSTPSTPSTPRHTVRHDKRIPDLEDAQTQSTLKAKFQVLMESVGIEENLARAASNFCFGTFEMEDPAQIWQALRECLQIGQPGMKKQIWRLWTKQIRVEPPDALVQEVTNWGRGAPQASTQVGRRFVAIDGQVLPTTHDDTEGLSMTDAVRLASFQKGGTAQAQPGHEGGMVNTLIQQQGETERKRLELEAKRQERPEGESVVTAVITQFGEIMQSQINKPQDNSFEVRLEAQRREFETRMEAQHQRFLDMMSAQGERHEHMLEMVQTQNTHALEMVKVAMEGSKERPSFLEQLEEYASSAIFEKLTKPAPAPISMITGPDGKGMMTLEVYKAINEMNFKSEALSIAKEHLPRLIEMGLDAAEATRRLAASRGHTIAADQNAPPAEQGYEEPPGPAYKHIDCANCGQPMSFPAEANFVLCPYCRAGQTADGELVTPKLPPVEPERIPDVQEESPVAPPDLQRTAQADLPIPSEDDTSPLLLGTYFLNPVEPSAPTPTKAEELRELESAAASGE